MTLWGGRFTGEPDRTVWEFTTDPADRRLLGFDLQGSIAHATMLGETGIIGVEEADSIVAGLALLVDEATSGTFEFVESDEDVHTAVERRLGELIGDTAGRLHTGRSRNDQIALDLRLYLREAAAERIGQLYAFVSALATQAEMHAATIVPGYTHLQQAQPTTLGHHLLAYAWMAIRDAGRFNDARARMSRSPLGAGAVSGSSLPLDRDRVAVLLGLDGVEPNSIDAVGARDFVAEYVFCCAQTAVHLSRLAEELLIWATSEFGWARFPDALVTGSSALPQKRNLDVAELTRGRTAGVIGDLTAILSLQKGLPLAYNRDLQEDKRIVFSADDVTAGALRVMTLTIASTVFDPPAPEPATVSLDLAEVLVGRGVPFREAHRIVGELILRLEGEGRELDTAGWEDLRSSHPVFEKEDLARLDPAVSVAARATKGSGSLDSVNDQVAELRRLIGAG